MMGKLESDTIVILEYAHSQWPRWVSITELSEHLSIPSSTLRNIFLVCDTGIFLKYDDNRTSIHSDAFRKIATKFNFSFKIKKMINENGQLSWHISAVKTPYNYE